MCDKITAAGEPATERKSVMKVLIKGAGDLASGIACRLYRSGCSIVMTETAVPTTVRRTVAFSPAIYMGRAMVEEIEGVRCNTLEEMEKAVENGQIPVVEDPECRIVFGWNPDVVVDAIIAKRNLGTSIMDAETVISVGPGFTAGVDCHCVVETKRGHNLGRCIWEGCAFPNTGVPGMIGGYDKERIIRASVDGVFFGRCSIGDLVEKGQTVGVVVESRSEGVESQNAGAENQAAGAENRIAGAEVPIYAQIDGVVRGLLQDGVVVKKGMKSGDIDPRGEVKSCFTVSDKASAIGGGVLEAICMRQRQLGRRILFR